MWGKRKITGHAIHGKPRRKIKVGQAVRRRGAARDIDVSLAISSEIDSARRTLEILAADGLVAEGADGLWRWVGGDLLLGWGDISPARRDILGSLLRAGTEMTANQLADGQPTNPRLVHADASVLVDAGWLSTRMQPGRGRGSLFFSLTADGRAATERALSAASRTRAAAEISTSSADAA
jgi:predicted ArsR family transcriptional regulator